MYLVAEHGTRNKAFSDTFQAMRRIISHHLGSPPPGYTEEWEHDPTPPEGRYTVRWVSEDDSDDIIRSCEFRYWHIQEGKFEAVGTSQ